MSWMFGEDKNGRPIGYGVEAECDEDGCSTQIDRGLSYRCGGHHFDVPTCEGFFCEEHRTTVPVTTHDGDPQQYVSVCIRCAAELAEPDAEDAAAEAELGGEGG